MKGSWRLLVIAGVGIVAVLAFVIGQSVTQLRSLLSSTSEAVSAGVDEAEPGEPFESSTADVLPESADQASSDAVFDEEAADELFAESASDEPSGPPTGEEFARLLEEGLIEDVDPEAAEEYLRALRERETAPE